MIKFLIKGLLRDKSRSLIPLIVVSAGVMLTVFMHAYITGFMGDSIEMSARFSTGHMKVMTQSYSENIQQIPNDLCLMEVNSLLSDLNSRYAVAEWYPRIQFAGLLDAPDDKGETKTQGPAIGLAIDLFSHQSDETERLNLSHSLVRGTLPGKAGEAMISEEFSKKLKVNPGDRITLISSTMYGGMTISNFTLSGTLRFGQEALDRSAMIADIEDIRSALNMEDAAGEIVGYFRSGFYDDKQARRLASSYNENNSNTNSEFDPVMFSLSQQGTMKNLVSMAGAFSKYISLIFILAMSLVLWNAGLLGGLRRYGEVGIRLAMGESKGHVYGSLISESVMIGLAGSIAGTCLGLLFAWLVQKYGIDVSEAMKGSAILIPEKLRARITSADFYLGFIPGLLSTLIGTLLSGRGIFKRQTARLFKELEV